MSGAPWHVFGTSHCPQCGADVPVDQLLRGGHRCDPADLEAHEAEQLQARLVVLCVEIAEYLDGPAGRNRLAFARWCREHGR
ncbi:MAG TPA: hypothetical protein VNO56_09950 [Gaiellaceae bacterium]|nr:hypothetical protein [Gaiellaceae bacterium]